MQRLKPHDLFPFLLAIWTVIFLVALAIVELLGRNTPPDADATADAGAAQAFIAQWHTIGWQGWLAIWFLGAAILFILRRWMRAVAKGPGAPYDVKIQNQGKTIESSTHGDTEKF